MNALSIFKSVTKFAVSAGVGTIVASAARSAVPFNPSMYKKVTVFIGATVLSNMVADQATKYTEGQIDRTVEEVNKVVKIVEANIKAEQQ